MRTEPGWDPKSSWPRTVVKKWLTMRTGSDKLQSDCRGEKLGEFLKRRRSCSDTDRTAFMITDPSGSGWLVESSDKPKSPKFRPDPPVAACPLPAHSLRMFVGTWNVGGRSPHGGLNLRDWLMSTASPADIYVLGFQEIVPLNAGNVLVAEDKGPAFKWLSLIRQALTNVRKGTTFAQTYTDATEDEKPRASFADILSASMEHQMEEDEAMDSDTTSNHTATSVASTGSSSSSGEDSPDFLTQVGSPQAPGYRLVASKQMVGLFLCVWVRAGLMQHLTSLKVSCVGRGIMGYMGNKGSISVSMTLRSTTFCFVCTHLTSGEKDGHEARRNSDVVKILKRTRFSASPDTILQHDKVIWLGDLNYRLATGCGDMDEMLQKNDWQSLLDKDQLRIEQRAGRVFTGWEEGRIYFPPTYKYLANSDRYAVKSKKPGDKRRRPAWCDRILWRGKGMQQMWYARGESQFSDHRPVYAFFSILVEAGHDRHHRAEEGQGRASSTGTTQTDKDQPYHYQCRRTAFPFYPSPHVTKKNPEILTDPSPSPHAC